MNKEKYPRTDKFLHKTGFTLDEALIWTEKELGRREKKRGLL